ncbi:M1 family metallopeptidase [Cellulomonas aerilata]|uniref:M1 family metallopeptidase n=1 Tax=Cellulomonas aerilata TaxID=515326 RepID=UPI001C99DB20|nr:M1 family metallopeptidase [Cellulomonas aerilata]
MRATPGLGGPRPDPYAFGHGDPRFHVEHYDLELDYRVRTNRLSGTAHLRVRTLEPLSELRLDLSGLSVHGVLVDGAPPARYRHRGGTLTVRLADPAPAQTVLGVHVTYAGAPRPVASPWGEVGWEELEDGVIVASQPTGAPSWFPCNDRPDDRATYRTSVTVENPYVVVAHGTPVAARPRAGATTWEFDEPYPTSTYLATVQIGRYADVVLVDAPVRQRVLVPPHLVAGARRRLARQPQMMDAFVDLFGPYPFDAYTLVVTPDPLEIPLEAQGMAVFGSNHLGSGADDDAGRLVPHELAHQWFGNSVSVAGWQHIWLNEGFACYAEWLWSEVSGGPTTDALASDHHDALARLPQDLTLADPGPSDLFDDRVYKRGALTLHALRRTLGDAPYRELVHTWTGRHRGGTVTTADLRALAAEVAGRSGGEAQVARVEELLTDWLDRPALPPLPGPAPSLPRRLLDHLRHPTSSRAPS